MTPSGVTRRRDLPLDGRAIDRNDFGRGQPLELADLAIDPRHSLPRKTPFPGGGELSKPYYDAMDPWPSLPPEPFAPASKPRLPILGKTVSDREPFFLCQIVRVRSHRGRGLARVAWWSGCGYRSNSEIGAEHGPHRSDVGP